MQTSYNKASKALFFEDANTWVTLTKIFSSILQDLSLYDTYLIINILNECVINLLRLLDFITQILLVFPHVK